MMRLRIAALGLTAGLVLALGYLDLRPEETLAVPSGARSGSLQLRSCSYDTEAGARPADCGTLIVPENRRNPDSALIALPVVRVRSASAHPAEPIFRLNGGPGATNLEFPQASRLTANHDVVLVGYRGVDGSRRLDCPEVTAALRRAADLGRVGSVADAFSKCAARLARDGVDVTGYSIAQRVDDLEAARTALGYQRIDLISSSAGTRTAMVYSWRHPDSLNRSVMIGANPPGHFVWDPRITDRQLDEYSELCRADARCSASTKNLAESIRDVADDVPDRWGPLSIKEGNVRIAGFYGMFHSTGAAAPLNAPTMVDALLAARRGDASGLWAMSVLVDLTIPTSFVWGEFASFGMIDAPAAERYYAAGGDPGSALHGTATDLLWGGAQGFSKAWPDSPDNAEYRTLRPSSTPTLVVSGTVDFTTPAQVATDELLPTLTNGRQVKLADLGHSADFWGNQPEAGIRLLTAFFDTGTVDDSGFRRQPVNFDPGTVTMPHLAKALVTFAILAVLVAAALLVWMARRRGFGRVGGVLLRVLAPLPLGLGGCLFAVLLLWTLWPRLFIGDPLVAVPPVALTVGFGAYLAWRRAGRPRFGLPVALTGALLGAVLGVGAATDLMSLLTTIVGAAAVANLALLLLERPLAVGRASRG